MGVVYRATELALDRPVALKLIAPELAGDASVRERFLRESRLAASIDHAGILPVYTAGEVDGWVCSAGTGGTLTGAGSFLKERKPAVRVALADPHGSGLYHYYAHGEIKVEGSSITEGIGNSRITKNLEGGPIDTAYRIPDSEAIPLVFQLLAEQGLCLGGSSGINVAGAIRLARELGPGHVVVTVLCDTGLRYLKRLYNPEFLRSKGVEVPAWLGRETIEGAAEVEVPPA